MKKTMAVSVAAAGMFALAGSLVAHHSLSQFDLTTAVTVKGAIVRVELVNPHSILYLDQKGADGQTQRWAVEGPGVVQLSRTGFSKDALKAGDVIEACGYVMKEGAESQRTISGRLLDAELLVLPGGQKQKWSDYGQHKCLGPDYHDSHK